MDDVDGRREDYGVLEDGTRIGWRGHVFKGMTRVREAQLYQPEVGKLIVRVAKGEGYDAKGEEEKLRREREQRLGETIDFSIEYVDRIERSGRGKFRFVVSDVDRPALDGNATAWGALSATGLAGPGYG